MGPASGNLAKGSMIAGRYRLAEVIGAGGMASVWSAEDGDGGDTVALKILADNLAHDEAFVSRFEREAAVARELDHPNLVAALDSGRHGERPYLVMELVAGGTLADALEASGAGSVVAEELALQLLGALEHVHRAGIVHRDVKPANVLLGEDGAVKLTDFGIALPADATSLTQTGQVIGTLDYMAPEVRAGEPATPRSDLFACGVVINRCMGPGGPDRLRALVAALTDPDPERRPSSAAAAAASIAPTAVASATARPPGAVVPVPPPRVVRVDPRRALAATALALLAAAVAGIALLADGEGEVGERPREPDSRLEAQRSEPGPAPEPEPEPAPPPEPEPEPAPVTDCERFDEQKERLGDRKKAAEERAGDDKEAKELVKDRYEAREERAEERKKRCEEREKEADEETKKGEEEDEGD